MKDQGKHVLIEKDDQVFAQGDVFFKRVTTLPTGCKPATSQVIAHSETGHHHTARAAQVLMHPTDTEVGYLVFKGGGSGMFEDMPRIEHERPTNPHRTLVLDGEGIIEFRRQREYTPEGYAIRVLD